MQQSHPFFDLFEAPRREELAHAMRVRNLREGTTLFEDGEVATELYLLFSGHIHLSKQDQNGRAWILAEVGPGEYFGEFGVFDGAPRSARAAVIVSSCVGVLDRECVLDAVRKSSAATALDLMTHLTRKLRTANDYYLRERIREERLAMMGRTLNMIAHDLRNPLAAISMAAECLLRSADGGENEYYGQTIVENSERIHSMIEDLMDFARGEHRLTVTSFRLKPFLDSVAETYRSRAEQCGVTLDVEAPEVEVRGDERKLRRAVQNLVSNSLQASPSGTAVKINARKRAWGYTIRVEDEAGGIPEELRQHLFDPFVTRGKTGGQGLGLAIVQSLVRAHGGSVSWEETAKGTRFRVDVPSDPES
ncbi:ATP-binding protein [Kiritimatiella glycovorans]|uniref:histidine kinase n=1 Tax=Kiritimatiella glycovorans TaxID=1307763 RepID=A0A0G3EEI5_9BACT|nr:ATP-binding protein [Kiritimatiella glycovorans]AKJ64861.1 Signal-transduction histidine kinase senX3 [Kiritimatiella glycovorans]